MNISNSQQTFLWLDSVAGWRGKWPQLAQDAATGALRLQALPSLVRQIFPGAGPVNPCMDVQAPSCPVAIAAEPCHGVLLLDSLDKRLFRGDVTTGQLDEIPCVGGSGSDVRNFQRACAVALLQDGSLAILDAASLRIAIFSPDPYALVALIPLARTTSPVALATDTQGTLLVADAAARQVLRFHADGTALKPLGEGTLEGPSAIAVNDDWIAVLDRQKDGQRIVLLHADKASVMISLPDGFRYEALAFDEQGALYTGAVPLKGAEGSILRIVFLAGGPTVVGFGALGVAARAIALANLPGTGILALLHSALERKTSIWLVDGTGASSASGQFVSDVLDSRIERCSWHRLVVEGTIPPGASLTLESVTGPAGDTLPWTAAARSLTITGGSESAIQNPDFLIQSSPGRLLRLRLTLKSSISDGPVITGMRIEYPRSSYLQYLPAVFQEDPESRFFLERFLSLFQSYNDDQDRRIDGFANLFSARGVPADDLGWLAAVVGQPLDPLWDEAKKRRMLTGLFQYDSATGLLSGRYPSRGTPSQVAQEIADRADVDGVELLEHYRLRSWLDNPGGVALDGSSHLWSADIYRRLQVGVYSRLGYFRLLDQPEPALEPLAWGAHRFSVFFQARAHSLPETRRRVAKAVESTKPAHTMATLCPVLPRFRVEFQSTIGVDTVLAEVDHMVLGQIATLDYDAVLAPPARSSTQMTHPGLPFGIQGSPRTEISTVLL